MKTKDKELFDLIHSLTKNEKGYFVKFAASLPGKSSDTYLKLYRAMEGISSLSSNNLNEHLKGIDIKGQPHRVRHYLYHSILDCLEYLHRSKTSNDKVISLIRKARILQSKGLALQSNNLLGKAYSIASMTHQHNATQDILRVRNGNFLSLGHDFDSEILLNGIDEMCDHARMLFQSRLAYRAYAQLYGQFKLNGAAQSEREEHRYEKLFEALTSEIQPQHLDKWGFCNLSQAKHLLGLCVNKIDVAIEGLAGIVGLYKETSEEIEYPQVLATASLNLHTLYIKQGAFELATRETGFLEYALESNKGMLGKKAEEDIRESVVIGKMALLAHQPSSIESTNVQFENLIKEIESIEPPRPQRVMVLFTQVVYHLNHGNHRAALRYINKFLNDSDYRDHDGSMLIEIELLNLILHAKLGNLELMESLINSLRRRYGGQHIWKTNLMELLTSRFVSFRNIKTSERLKEWKNETVKLIEEFAERNKQRYVFREFDYLNYFNNRF